MAATPALGDGRLRSSRPVIAPRPRFSLALPDGQSLSLGDRPLVMGVLNLTPDSFADAVPLAGSAAVDAALAMVASGADLIDIGGESTRPGAAAVSADEERRRVEPVVAALARQVAVPISIDTTKAAVAAAAIDAGAQLVNDISGLRYDPQMAHVVAARRAGVVLMHMRGRPADMYREAVYDDVVAEVVEELRQCARDAMAAGVDRARIVVDPGIGFAKRPVHNYRVLADLGRLALLDLPVLVGPSRKSFMAEALDQRPAPDRDWGTAAAVTAAVLGGAHIIRVHAVDAMVQVVRVADAIRSAADAAGPAVP